MQAKLDWQWPAAIVFAVVFISLAALTYTGKVPASALLSLLAWLVPSPAQVTSKPSAGS